MKNIVIFLFILLPSVACARDGFYNNVVRFTVDYPELGQTIADVHEEIVGDDIEFVASGGNFFIQAVPVVVDVSAYEITFSWEDTYSGQYDSSEFNGYVFTDVYGKIDKIIQVEYETNLEINEDDITFNDDQSYNIHRSSLKLKQEK